MKEQLEKIKAEALASLEDIKASADLDALRVKYLGKKGELTGLLKQMGSLSAEERPIMGQLVNEVKASLESALEAASNRLETAALEARLREKPHPLVINTP